MPINSKSIILGLVGATFLATAASAGGLDRSTFSAGLLFEKGNYVEGSFGYVMPNIKSANGAFDINPDYSQINFGAKFDLHERFSVAFSSYEPVGSKIVYPFLRVDISSRAFTAVGRANYNGFSVYAGPAYYTVKGETFNLLAAAGISGPISHEQDGAFGWIGGVAYERKEIALRVSLTYESGAKFALVTPAAARLGGITSAAIPEAWTLNFQSGVAADTLVFGSIRHALHSNSNIFIGPVPISNFSNSTTYTLGVGRKLTDKLDASISAAYEGSNGAPSTFAPTGNRFTLSLGGKYKLTEKVSISAGMSHTWLGDNSTQSIPGLGQVPFTNNTAWVVGTKVGISF